MKKLINELTDITSNIKGKVICFGIDDKKILKMITSNNNIEVCDILSLAGKKGKFLQEKTNEKFKKINIRNLRKKYKKKKIDYIYINIDDFIDYKETFVKDSIYICKNKIYIYSKEEKDITNIIRRYKRYKINIEIIKCLDNIVYEVNIGKIKTNRFKDKFNSMIDYFIDLADYISSVM